jgi:1-acyl-sn-glycerol-3-phosphate acyltransferase
MGWSVLILQDGLLISTFCIARLLIKFAFLPCTGFIQKTILESVGCIWFNRNDLKDREVVAKKLRDHVQHPDSNPLLIFPEGTCVNNQYTVMFKKVKL